eukprot:CAMPEP_0168561510 /NCGR_PEP_ID=MMETSP0413-20121227/11632_1 /TAXON_ID=136452 /ORGANISM="Filamoeba nolandi, Strain NC-AS-23-1" /LENGTH=129 /DNA_ID=CAMNT_0008592883 /DNA_START=228 /DNA_END=613 /DNA_ORIENTATION=+
MDFEVFFKHVQHQVWYLDAIIWRRHFQSRKVRKSGSDACACCGIEHTPKTQKPKDIIDEQMEKRGASKKRKRDSDDDAKSVSLLSLPQKPELLCQTCCGLHQHRNQQLALLHRLCSIGKSPNHEHAKRA